MFSLHACMCLVLAEARRGLRIPYCRVVSHCGCWDSNLSPLQEQPLLLATEPSLQPLKLLRFYVYALVFGLHVFLSVLRVVGHLTWSYSSCQQPRGCWGLHSPTSGRAASANCRAVSPAPPPDPRALTARWN